MSVDRVTVPDSVRQQVQGTPIEFGRLAMFQDEIMNEYMTHVIAIAGEAKTKGSMIQSVAEAWLQDDGGLLVIIPARGSAHRTMIVPKGKWRLLSDAEFANAPTGDDLIAGASRTGALDAMARFMGTNLKSAENYFSELQREREAYDRAHSRGGIVLFSKSREGLINLDAFAATAPFCEGVVRKFRSDHSKRYLLLFFSAEDRKIQSFAFANLEEALGGGMKALAKAIGGDLGQVGIGSGIGGDDIRAILEKWEALGGAKPFGKDFNGVSLATS